MNGGGENSKLLATKRVFLQRPVPPCWSAVLPHKASCRYLYTRAPVLHWSPGEALTRPLAHMMSLQYFHSSALEPATPHWQSIHLINSHFNTKVSPPTPKSSGELGAYPMGYYTLWDPLLTPTLLESPSKMHRLGATAASITRGAGGRCY